jgi:hypothetical protein
MAMKARNYLVTLAEREGTELGSFSPLQLLFLTRLSSLLRLRHDCMRLVSEENWRMKLLNKSLYSTFRDCVEQGIEPQAHGLFRIEKESPAEE